MVKRWHLWKCCFGLNKENEAKNEIEYLKQKGFSSKIWCPLPRHKTSGHIHLVILISKEGLIELSDEEKLNDWFRFLLNSSERLIELSDEEEVDNWFRFPSFSSIRFTLKNRRVIRCSECREIKPITEYYKSNKNTCKKCLIEKAREYEENPYH